MISSIPIIRQRCSPGFAWTSQIITMAERILIIHTDPQLEGLQTEHQRETLRVTGVSLENAITHRYQENSQNQSL